MEDNFVKVINSTYKLLEFFPDGDPLKYKAKEKALEILENLTLISDVGGWTSLKKEKAGAELLDDIEIMKNYLQLGKHQGWVGGINFLILLKEYDKIKSQIKPAKSVLSNVMSDIAQLNQIKSLNKEKEKHNEPILLQPPLTKVGDEQRKGSLRQQKILNIINSMGRAQVSDIIKEVPNVTKRTIRRDLDELLKKAKVVRNGEWNKVFYQIS